MSKLTPVYELLEDQDAVEILFGKKNLRVFVWRRDNKLRVTLLGIAASRQFDLSQFDIFEIDDDDNEIDEALAFNDGE